MGNPKADTKKAPPGVYRDDPDRDDAASISSAVLLGDMDYPEEEPPSYSDIPAVNAGPFTESEPQSRLIGPPLPFATLSSDKTTTTCLFPNYSESASDLRAMLLEQSKYPPIFQVRLHGTHTETIRRKDNKTEKNNITDFDIRLQLTHLIFTHPSNHYIETAPDSLSAHRGGRTKTTTPSPSSEDNDILSSWCRLYVENPASVKSFALTRTITDHDSARLETLLSSLVGSTNYRGHLKVSFPVVQNRIVVYSPHWINQYRQKTWLRWIFYLTFLWIFTWPLLLILERKYDVVKVVWPYKISRDGGCTRTYAVQSEDDWFKEWKVVIKGAVFAKKQGWVDAEYRAEAEASQADGRGRMERRPSTGSAFADGAVGFLQGAVRVGREVQIARGWGADS